MPVSLAEGLDYATLFEAGARFTQTSAADAWTDYNLHDPGVTILEQLCYALTDLAYRAGWPIEDLLAEPPTGAAFAAQPSPASETALFTGPDILTTAPVTEHDFRSRLFADVDNLQNAWLRREPGSRGIRGLHAIDVQLYDPPGDAANPTSPGAWATYLAARPLCEDVRDIPVLGQFLIQLGAEIEIDNTDTANDIAANVFVALQENLLPTPIYASLDLERERGRGYDEIFEGPRMDILIANLPPDRRPQELAAAQFARVAGTAAGVRSIRALALAFDANGRRETATSMVPWGPDRVPSIDVAATLNAGSGFRLVRGGGARTLEPDRVLSNIQHRKYMSHAEVLATMREIRSDPYNRPPTGVFRSPGTYVSIRGQFPRIYGLGPYGAPSRILVSRDGSSRADEGRDAKIAQLGGYLAIFEQVMANHLEQLARIPTLFSLGEAAGEKTYFCQKLDAGVLPRDYANGLEAIVERQDPKLDRRARWLDHLLARFNEAFPDEDWQVAREAERQSGADADALLKARNAAKAEFLSDYAFVGAFRGAGCDYSRPLAEPAASDAQFGSAVSGLERRVKLLTGIAKLFVVEHILLRDRADEADGDLADFYSLRLSVVAPRSATEDAGAMEAFVARTVEDNCPAHIEAECGFLEASQMADFERLHDAWRRAYAQAFARPPAATTRELDRRSLALRTFLKERLTTETS